MELRRRETGESYTLEDGMVLGRLDSCAVKVEDGSISRRHAKIEAAGLGYDLVDLGSSNGIFQNGSRKERFELRPGDLITLGAVAFDVVGGTPAATASTDLGGADDLSLEEEDEAHVDPEPTAAPSSSIEEAARKRAQIRREIEGDGRSKGLGDLGQQPFGIKVLVAILAIAVCYGVVTGIRILGANL